MAGLLTAYLDGWLQRPERYGVNDCALFMADWIKQVRGFDPAAPWRGRYDNSMQALRIVKRAGGLVKIVGKALEARGLERTGAPKSGDVAIANPPADRAAFGGVGAIFVSPQVLAMPGANDGLIVARADLIDVLAAWSV